jgi:hypothetical protein
MTQDWNNSALKTFIKNTLGCGCPDSVFEKIEVKKHQTSEYPNEFTRIVVGDTLLIYIIRPADNSSKNDSIEAIALNGKDDRDSNHYNRFRLVLASNDRPAMSETLEKQFIKSSGTDDKMHIHFIPKEQIEGL